MLKVVARNTGPVFRAYRTSVQAIPSLVPTKVAFNAENFDTSANFSNGTFTPATPGYYQINSAVRFDSTYGFMRVMIYKNNSLYSIGTDNTAVGSANVSDIVYCNGSTDYIEIYVMTNANVDIASGSENTWVSGSLISY